MINWNAIIMNNIFFFSSFPLFHLIFLELFQALKCTHTSQTSLLSCRPFASINFFVFKLLVFFKFVFSFKGVISIFLRLLTMSPSKFLLSFQFCKKNCKFKKACNCFVKLKTNWLWKIWWQSFGRLIASCCLKPWKTTSFYINIKFVAISTWRWTQTWVIGSKHKIQHGTHIFSWFSMTIRSGLSILEWVESSLCKLSRKDTKYRFVIHVGIRVKCFLYKFFHGVDYLQCSEMFTIGKSSMNMVLHNFVFTINEVFRNQIWWPQGEDLSWVMVGFRDLCGLLSIHGVIDCTQIHIQKLTNAFTTSIYSYKLKAHSLQFQVVIDHDKHFVMYLWTYRVPWMTPKYHGCVIFTRKQLTMACSTLVSLDAKMKFILTFSGIKVIPY